MRRIDGPLDNYSPFQPFDSGPQEGDPDDSVCSSASEETSQKFGDRPRDWPKGNKFNICYACGNTFRGPGWKIKPLCAVCEPEIQPAVNVERKCPRCRGTQTIGDRICPRCGGAGYDIGVPADGAASLSEWYDEVERNQQENEREAQEREWAAQEQLQEETDA